MAFASCLASRSQPSVKLNLAAKEQVVFAGCSGQQSCCGEVAAGEVAVAVAKGAAAESGVGGERRLSLFLCARPLVCAGHEKLSESEGGFAAAKE